jgi:hypothetical protein
MDHDSSDELVNMHGILLIDLEVKGDYIFDNTNQLFP